METSIASDADGKPFQAQFGVKLECTIKKASSFMK